MARLRGVWMLIFVMCGALGCGGDGVDCSFSACGGDPTGSWSIEGTCYDASGFLEEFQQQCPEATGGVGLNAEGTYDLEGDQSFTISVSLTIRTRLTVPAACLQQGLTSCAQLNSEDLVCNGNPEVDCDCTFDQNEDISESGTWSSSGSTLTLDDESPQDFIFCVEGDTLKIQNIPEDPGDPSGVIVLSRN